MGGFVQARPIEPLGGVMGYRLLTWSAILFGIVIPIAFLVFAWFTLR